MSFASYKGKTECNYWVYLNLIRRVLDLVYFDALARVQTNGEPDLRRLHYH